MAKEKDIKTNGEKVLVILSENFIHVKTGCLKFQYSYRFLDASLDKISITLTSFPSLDANGLEDVPLKEKFFCP